MSHPFHIMQCKHMNGYDWLKQELKELFNMGAKVTCVGRSVLGRKVYAVEIGTGPCVLLQYGIHAREHVTTTLAVLHAKMLIEQKPTGISYVLIPMANPDGTELALFGTRTCGKFAAWLDNSFEKESFPLWKANVRGVDLNNNFDAKFGCHSCASVPGPHGFCGPYPESEPETKNLVRLAKRISPCLSISFHTKGEVVSFDFFQSHRNRIRDKKIAQLFAQDFGYAIKSTQEVSSGGFKDWCVATLGIPSLTVELASDTLSHPIPSEYAKVLFEKTKNLHELCKKAIKILQSENKDAT